MATRYRPVIIAGILLISGLVFHFVHFGSKLSVLQSQRLAALPKPDHAPHPVFRKITMNITSVGTAAQGSVFEAAKVRSFHGAKYFASSQPPPLPRYGQAEKGQSCHRWAVITTIFEPTPLSHQLAALDDW